MGPIKQKDVTGFIKFLGSATQILWQFGGSTVHAWSTSLEVLPILRFPETQIDDDYVAAGYVDVFIGEWQI